jgi:DNA-binding XRE family transcriptional regulator
MSDMQGFAYDGFFSYIIWNYWMIVHILNSRHNHLLAYNRVQTCDLLLDMRKKNSKTQQQLAEHLGMSLRLYQYYESGKHEMRTTDFLSLCDTANITQ